MIRYANAMPVAGHYHKYSYSHDVSWLAVLTSGNYRGADKSLFRPGRKQANVSVRMA